MRRSGVAFLKARPKTVKTEVGCNRFLDEKTFAKAKDYFEHPPYPGKKAIHNWRFFIKPGKAATGPPVGQEFSKLGLKPMDFCKAFNDRTKPAFKEDADLICRVQVFHDLTYTWRIEPPPTAWFIMRAVTKKRRETGFPTIKGSWACYITLEMCYEIAKYKQWNWNMPEYPPIEVRARSVAAQARRMGIAILGVDAPSSPVKDLTPAQYEKQSAEYRKQQWAQWEAFKENEFNTLAPLSAKVHRPDLMKFSEETLRKGVSDIKLLAAIYTATSPRSKYNKDAKSKALALHLLQTSGAVAKDLTLEDAAQLYFNWKVPALARMQRLTNTVVEETPHWTLDALRRGAQS